MSTAQFYDGLADMYHALHPRLGRGGPGSGGGSAPAAWPLAPTALLERTENGWQPL